MIPSALCIDGVTVRYGSRTVVHDLRLSPLPRGTVTALVGPNAAGKSTLLRAIAGLVPASGTVLLDGRDLLAMPRHLRAERVGFMPQALPAGVSLSVLETVVAATKAVSPAGAERQLRERAVAVLERLDAVGLALEPLERLSGGQRQIAALAQALAPDPALLLLDEPTSALDLRHQFHIMRMARELARGGRIVVIVLHDLGLAAEWADRIVVLDRGRLYSEGQPSVAITPEMLRAVYGVAAEVVTLPRGTVRIEVRDLAAS